MKWHRQWALDPKLVGVALVLSLFGVAMIFSAGVLNVPNPVTEGAWLRQVVWLVLSLGAFTVITRVKPVWIEWVSVPAYLVAVILLGLTLVIGTGSGTAEGVEGGIEMGEMLAWGRDKRLNE